MQGSGSQALKTPALASPASQPNFVAQVVDRTGNFTSTSGVFGDINGLAAFDFANSTNMLLLYAGASLTATAADSTWHTVQFTLNGGSSEIIVDGGTPTTGAAGAGVMSAALLIFKEGFGNFLVGNITEMGLWSGTQSAPDKASLNANQRAYWGF
jgi:hypothetical protein